MDVIAYTTYGIELDTQSDPDNMFVTKSKKALDITLRSPKLILICQLTLFSLKYSTFCYFLHDILPLFQLFCPSCRTGC